LDRADSRAAVAMEHQGRCSRTGKPTCSSP
jgi:hypothetical protein